MQNKFLQALHSGRVLLMDGAMGSQLQRTGLRNGECGEQWNLTNPDRVQAIHRAYLEAGAEVLLTNTFQANPSALVKHDLQDELEPIFQSGLSLARKAAGSTRFVLAAIGPLGDSPGDLARVAAFAAEADGLLFETLSDLLPVRELSKIRDDRPVLVSCTYHHHSTGDLQTFTGLTPEVIARQAIETGVQALGVNCGRDIDMDDVIEIVRRYRAVTDLPLFARPNAGTPEWADGQWIYPRTPEQMAVKFPEFLEAGVSMVGGCCGTTPGHIALFRRAIDVLPAIPLPRRP